MALNEKEATIGLEVQVQDSPITGEIICSPQYRNGAWYVLISGVGDWIPLRWLTTKNPY